MPKGAVAPGKVWPSGPVPIIGSTKASGSGAGCSAKDWIGRRASRSEEHTSELQSLMRISYAVFCLKKKKNKIIEMNSLQTTLKTKYKTNNKCIANKKLGKIDDSEVLNIE